MDVVDVFRPPAEAETVARDAVAIGAKVLWFQPGTHTDEAVRLAAKAGLEVVADRCMGETHGRRPPLRRQAEPSGLAVTSL